MIEVMQEKKNCYLSNFEQFEKKLKSGRNTPFDRLRKDAIARFADLGFPTTRDEEWKYTNVQPVASIPFKPAGYKLDGLTPQKLRDITYNGIECSELVFVNGHYSKELSTLRKLPAGTRAGSLAAALESDRAVIEEHLARHAEYRENAFTALNTAFLEDGAFIFVPKGATVLDPIHLVFVSTLQAEAAVSHPRTLILVGDGSQVTIIETYVGLGSGVYFTNAVTELVAGEGSIVDHYKLQRESEKAFHIATLQVRQERGSNFSSHSIAMGGSLVRNDINTTLDGVGGECTLNGLYLTSGRQHVDNHTSIDHAQAHCNSRELYKGILDGKSSGVFNGAIVVRKDAQKTNAKQTNKNLLLSEDALVNTKPQLQISADDVKCTHGATIGQLDEEALFYLRSRGIPEAEARDTLTYAFASDVVNAIKIEPIRLYLDGVIHKKVHPHEKGKEAYEKRQ